jgi:anti-sigma factor RsiW
VTGTDTSDLVCQDAVELMSAYLDQALSAADRDRFDRHLAECEPCTAYLAQMRTTLELAGALGRSAPAAASATPSDRELVELFRRWVRK